MENTNEQPISTESAAPATTPATPPVEPVDSTPSEPQGGQPITPEPTVEKTVPLKALLEEQRKRQEAREEAAYYKGLVAANTPQATPAEVVSDGPPVEPTIDQFPEDYEAFERAQRRYIIEQAKYELKQETTRQQAESAKRQTQEQIDAAWDKSVKAAQTKYPDFMDAISNPDFRQSEAVAQAIKSSEAGGDLAYYLANNLDVANNLNAMNPTRAAFELGQIAAKILNTPKPTPAPIISQAPEPISTVGGITSSEPVAREDLPMEEYYKIRAPELVRRR